MKKQSFVMVMIVALLFSSCALVKSPLVGIIYTGVKSPVTATSHTNSTKFGVSQATSILGLFAFGNAGIDEAAKSAGITKIHHVDQKAVSVLGIFATYKVYVYGE